MSATAGRGGAWTEERGTSDEGRRRLQASCWRAGNTVSATLILDAEGLVKLASGDRDAMSLARDAHDREGAVVTAASTLAEVLRGGPKDAPLHRVLGRIEVIPISREHGRFASELLGRTGMSGHRCAMDALLAAVALSQPRPAVLLTGDPDDLTKLTDEPGRPKAERIAVVRA
jgi:predicted nucleic acid-binding protein